MTESRSPHSLDFQLSNERVDTALEAEQTWPRNPRAYLALVGCFFCMFNSWGMVNAFGTFMSYYKETLLLDTDILMLNLIGSTQSFIVLLFSAIIGRLLDAGYYRYLTGAGWVLISLGMFTLSQTTTTEVTEDMRIRHVGNYGHIWLTQGLTTGLGMACLFVSSSQIVATWFIKRKSFAIGIVACGASIAGVIYPVVIRYVIEELNWRSAVFCTAGIACATGLFTFVAAQPNPHHRLRKPERWLSVRTWIDTQAFAHTPFKWFVASISFMFFGFYAIFFNLEEWSVSKGVGYKGKIAPVVVDENNTPSMRTFYLLCIMNGASSLGRLGAAYASDHFGALNIHGFVMIVSSMLVLILWVLTTKLQSAVAFVLVFGAFSGAVIGLPPASVAHILGPHPDMQAKLGQWTGLMYTVAAPFALTGPVIAGYLATQYQSYITVQLWSGVCLLFAGICIGLAIWTGRNDQNMSNSFRKKTMTGDSRLSSAWVSTNITRRPSQDEKDNSSRTV